MPSRSRHLAPVAALVSVKVVVTAAASALIAFAFGLSIRKAAPVTNASANAGRPALSDTIAATNRRLTTEVQRMTADLATLQTDHDRLLAERANLPPARADGLIGIPLPRHEIQESVLKNLEKISVARDQFQLEHGRAPLSIEEIVGVDGYFKRLAPVDGEDYTQLSMEEGRVLVVTTLSGNTVKYGDGTGDDATTQVEYPPELAQKKALLAALRPSARAAYEAYRLANHGKDPEDTDALLPFFSTSEGRALYLEFIELNKAANRR